MHLCSGRLKNALTGYFAKVRGDKFKYIEDITEYNFMSTRNSGRVAWKEFIKLRGY